MLINMWQGPYLRNSNATEVAYRFSSGKTSQKGRGWIIEEKVERVLVFSNKIPKTVLSFPKLEIKRLEPQP